MPLSRNRSSRRRAPIARLIIGAGIALLLSACSGNDGDESLECPEDSVLTYDNFGDPFMRDWCTGCHSSDLPMPDRQGAPYGVDFDSREGVLLWRDRILVRAVGDGVESTNPMPPTGGPSAEELALLGEWIACGAP